MSQNFTGIRHTVHDVTPSPAAEPLDRNTRSAASLLFKIVPAALWRESEASGRFTGSPVDVRDGFIHLSTAAQLRDTVKVHFAGAADLLLVAVLADALQGLDLRWEPSRGGALFPHLHGELPLTAVAWVAPMPLDERGQHVFPT